MDLRLGQSRPRIIPRSENISSLPGRSVYQATRQAIDHAVDNVVHQARHQAPKAEAAAVRWAESVRPAWSWLAVEWRRLGTAAAVLLIVAVLLHAMFGANGMVVYQQKRAEMQSLQNEVERLQKENEQYVNQIKSLKSDPAAIEKEAREQLHYTRPGEVVYVAPDLPLSTKSSAARAKNGQ